jgi:arginine utilization regulatory protein
MHVPEADYCAKEAAAHGYSIYKIEEKVRSVMIDAERMHSGHTLLNVFWLRDWTENEDKEMKLQCAMEILDKINEGVITTDRDGRIIIYNKQLAEFEDLPQEEVIGKRLMDVYEWSMESSEHMQVLKTGIPITKGITVPSRV